MKKHVLGSIEEPIRFNKNKFIGRPLKVFLQELDHRDRVEVRYSSPDYTGSSGIHGRVHDVPWNHADDVVTDVKNPQDTRFLDYIIEVE